MRILAANGFVEVRRRGSHVVMQLRIEGTTRTVPVPDHDILRMGTLGAIIRQSGLDRALFEDPGSWHPVRVLPRVRRWRLSLNLVGHVAPASAPPRRS